MNKKNTKFFNIIELLLLITFIVISIVLSHNANMTDATYKMDKNPNIYYLNGNWEYYENKFIKSQDTTVNLETDFEYVKIPMKFTDSKSHAGSYRMIIQNIQGYSQYFISLNRAYGDIDIYINDELFSPESLSVDIAVLNINSENKDVIEIVIEARDANGVMARILKAPTLSTNKTIGTRAFLSSISSIAIFSCLIIVAILIVATSFVSDKKYINILFAIFCILTALNVLSQKNFYFSVYNTFINFNQYFASFVFVITTSLIPIMLYLFVIGSTYGLKSKINILFTIFSIIIYSCIILFICFTGFNKLLIIEPILFAINITPLIMSLTIICYNKSKFNSSSFYIWSIGIIIFCEIYDSLSFLNIINPINFRSTPVFIFILAVEYIIINSISNKQKIEETREIANLKETIRNTEFTFLNSQIQSHFIYNTLNSIQSLCYKDPQRAATLIEDFSRYLRTRLEFNKMPNLIPFNEELDNIKTYLNIEKARFGKRVNFEIINEASDFSIPPLSVQPLVENAVKHGISKKAKGGTVIIKSYEDDNNIYIIVSDDGIGFDSTQLPDKKRIGTENIRYRLNLHLNASLVIRSSNDLGTIATITIPKKK